MKRYMVATPKSVIPIMADNVVVDEGVLLFFVLSAKTGEDPMVLSCGLAPGAWTSFSEAPEGPEGPDERRPAESPRPVVTSLWTPDKARQARR